MKGDYVTINATANHKCWLDEDPTTWHPEDHFAPVDSYRPYYCGPGCTITRRWDAEFVCKSGRTATIRWVEYKDKNGKLREAVAQVVWLNK